MQKAKNAHVKDKGIVPLRHFCGPLICFLTELILPGLTGAKYYRVNCSCSGISHASQDRVFPLIITYLGNWQAFELSNYPVTGMLYLHKLKLGSH